MESRDGNTPTVLLVEYNSVNSDVLSRWLKKNGQSVIVATSAQEAMALMRYGRAFDGLLVNSVLPDPPPQRVVCEFQRQFPWRPAGIIAPNEDTGTEIWCAMKNVRFLAVPLSVSELQIFAERVRDSFNRVCSPLRTISQDAFEHAS